MDDEARMDSLAKARPRGNFFRLGLLCGLVLGALAGILISRDGEAELAEPPPPAAAPQGPPL
jgi:hypothetical protein